MTPIKEAAATFLAGTRIAVTGVSASDPRRHDATITYERLRVSGYQVFAVNPNTDKVEDDACFHALSDIPGGVDGVVIATGFGRSHHARMRRAGHHTSLDAPRARAGQRLPRSHHLWTRPRHHRHRRRLSPDVRADRRHRTQDDATVPHRGSQGAQTRLSPKVSSTPESGR
jgi:hypothetical protein